MSYLLQTFSVGQVLTAAQLNQLEENIIQYGKFKAVSFTRDTAAASGSQAVTGVGFTPKWILFLYGVSGSAKWGVGFSDITNGYGLYSDHNSSADTMVPMSGGSNIIFFESGGGANYLGVLASADADGFTITWTKTGSPTGTGTILALCGR